MRQRFPSPQVGSELRCPPNITFHIARFPSPQVGSERGTEDINTADYKWFPSPQVGSERNLVAREKEAISSFHPLKSGRNRRKRLNFGKSSEVSIPSSRVGTYGKNSAVTIRSEFPSPQVGSERLINPLHAAWRAVFPSPQVGSEQLRG